jgi:hypothetical protein
MVKARGLRALAITDEATAADRIGDAVCRVG